MFPLAPHLLTTGVKTVGCYTPLRYNFWQVRRKEVSLVFYEFMNTLR